jgi:hypothetical protein
MTCSVVEMRWGGTIIMTQRAREVGTGALLIGRGRRAGRVRAGIEGGGDWGLVEEGGDSGAYREAV